MIERKVDQGKNCFYASKKVMHVQIHTHTHTYVYLLCLVNVVRSFVMISVTPDGPWETILMS